jgi:hypothetical protein
MRTKLLVVVAGLVLALVWGALPASAQDIYGLSFRPTDAAPESSPRGTVDIVAGTDGKYVVTVDLSAADSVLKLANYPDADAFVVWSVDMDGKRRNLGVLDEGLVLGEAAADYLIAKLFLTAEADAAAAQPTTDRLYEVTLRNVAEVESTAARSGSGDTAAKPAAKTAAQAATAPTATTLAAPAASPTVQAPAGAAAPTAAAAKTETGKPAELPTTGNNARDLAVLLAVVTGLVLAGIRLRTLRV